MQIPAPSSSTPGSVAGSPVRPAPGAAAERLYAAVAARVRRPQVAIPVALVLVALIGAADYVTGFEVRLAILYILPVGLATWTCGRRCGLLVAILGSIVWAVSFASRLAYSHVVYFVWDCAVMAATLLLFAELLARLRIAMARSDERFVRVLDGLYAAVYVTDGDDRVLFANRRLARLFGSGARTPTATEITERFAQVKADAPGIDSPSPEFGFSGTEARDRNDGRWYVVQTGHIPWVDLTRVRLNVMTDITDQKLAQSIRSEHQAALHHTSRLMNLAEAATTLAHELNQPLIAIVGYNAACIRLLEAGTVDLPAVDAAMKKCRAQAVRAGEIVHRMRELARRRVPQLAPCDLNTMIRQQLAWVEGDLERAGVVVELALAPSLPRVPTDRILVEQVILNLVQNAIDAMHGTRPNNRRLRIESRRGEPGGAVVTVADRGEGIAPDVAERLFSTFFTTKTTGLGLGLSICRSVVEIHGGRIWHDANPEGGTAFHFTLPE